MDLAGIILANDMPWVHRHRWISTSRWSNAKKRSSERLRLRGEISKQTNTCLCVCAGNIADAILPGESGWGILKALGKAVLLNDLYLETCMYHTPLQDPKTISTRSAPVLQCLA